MFKYSSYFKSFKTSFSAWAPLIPTLFTPHLNVKDLRPVWFLNPLTNLLKPKNPKFLDATPKSNFFKVVSFVSKVPTSLAP